MSTEKTKFKLIFLGNIEVGKTSLIIRYVDNDFQEGKILNFDSKEKSVTVGGRTIQLQITDTAGQERFRTLTSSYYRNADAIIVLYDITNKESFDDVEGYIKEGTRYGSATSEKFLVGNKTDREDMRVVDTYMGEQMAKKHNIPFFETSAATGSQVDELFDSITKRLSGSMPANKPPGSLTIVDPSVKDGTQKKKGGCVLV